jgi:hypothetical protein
MDTYIKETSALKIKIFLSLYVFSISDSYFIKVGANVYCFCQHGEAALCGYGRPQISWGKGTPNSSYIQVPKISLSGLNGVMTSCKMV